MNEDLMIGGDMILDGPVGDFFEGHGFTAKGVRAALAQHDGDLTVHINSGGGSASEGEAIRAALKAHDGRVAVHVSGIAASAASLIAMAGDEIVMSEGAMLMIHDPSALTIGPPAEHYKTGDVLTGLAETYAAVYAARSGREADEVRQMMIAETWMNATQAIEMGFADRVEGATSSIAPYDFTAYQNAPERLRALARAKGWTSPAPKSAASPVKEAIMADGQKVAEKPANDVTDAIKEATAAERTRVRMIREACKAVKMTAEFTDDLIDQGVTMDQARAKILDKLAESSDDPMPKPLPTVTVMKDERVKFREAAEKAIMVKAGLGGERNEFCGMSLLEMARRSIEIGGGRVTSGNKLDVAAMAFVPHMMGASHTTSDFPAILENVANKAMLRGYDEMEETFQQWTSVGTLPDFKTGTRVGVDAFPALAKVTEDAEYTYATMGDYKETVVLATYGKMFAITRQAIVNDDLGAFTRVPVKMGRAARRTVGNLAYGVLTGNPLMGDGVALFASGHGNLASSGAAPSVTTLQAAMSAMATQTDRSGNATALNIRPAFIIAPYALRGTVMQLLESEYDPAKSTRAANTVRNAVTPIFDARLDADSTTAWYLAAAPSLGDTIEVSYLDGNDQPFLDSKEGWNVDGIEFKVRIDAAATPLAWEGLYKDPGT